jgi:hypothetical protein
MAFSESLHFEISSNIDFKNTLMRLPERFNNKNLSLEITNIKDASVLKSLLKFIKKRGTILNRLSLKMAMQISCPK